MPFKRDALLTAVRVRGKRCAAVPEEKWPTGKRRNPALQKRPVSVDQPRTNEQLSSRSRRQKQKSLEDESPLERLPAEVLQQVFEYSANIELPLVSRELAAKLSKSNHLQQQLTTRILSVVLGHPSASAKELASATRLLNSKFMTWEFFTTWLKAQVISTGLVNVPEGPWDAASATEAWLALQPPLALLPPKKLLSSPFNQEKVRFLEVLGRNIDDLAGLDASYGELGHECLFIAVRDAQQELVSLLLSMGLAPSTELLRVAVTESDCNKDIVRLLVSAAGDGHRQLPSESERSADIVDLLDPVLWAWADEARRRGDKKGEWLLGHLKRAQRRRNSDHTAPR